MAEDGSDPANPPPGDPADDAALARERAAHEKTQAALKLAEQRLASLLEEIGRASCRERV